MLFFNWFTKYRRLRSAKKRHSAIERKLAEAREKSVQLAEQLRSVMFWVELGSSTSGDAERIIFLKTASADQDGVVFQFEKSLKAIDEKISALSGKRGADLQSRNNIIS